MLGISPIFARFSYLDGAGPLTANAVRGLIMLAAFVLFLPGVAAALRRPDQARMVAILMLSYAGFALTYQLALARAGAGLCLVIVSTNPILLIAWQRIRGKKPVPKAAFVQGLLTLTGILILAAAEPSEDGKSGLLLGIALAVAAAVFCVWMTLAAADAAAAGFKAGSRNAAVASGMTLLFLPASLMAEGIALPATPYGWWSFLFAAVTMIAGIAAYTAAVGRIGALRVTLISNAEPAIGLFFAWAFLGENAGLSGLIGGTLACAGLIDLESLGRFLPGKWVPFRGGFGSRR